VDERFTHTSVVGCVNLSSTFVGYTNCYKTRLESEWELLPSWKNITNWDQGLTFNQELGQPWVVSCNPS
jgi:hypothetical protein